MPMDLDHSNHTIVKRIINKWNSHEYERSDTSRYEETKKLVVASMGGKQLKIEENRNNNH
jgi:hypothetical protein